MLEAMKGLALSIAVVGFALSVLLPFFLYIRFKIDNSTKQIKVLAYSASVIVLVLYFIILFYYIWIHYGFI